jgi:hypothetical protein
MKKITIILAVGMGLILLLGMGNSDLNSGGNGQNYDYEKYGQKVTDYQIIHANSLKALQEAVKEQLKNGLRPMGELSHFDKDYCQVMVK